jgi:hypothetical protein
MTGRVFDDALLRTVWVGWVYFWIRLELQQTELVEKFRLLPQFLCNKADAASVTPELKRTGEHLQPILMYHRLVHTVYGGLIAEEKSR